MNIISVTKKARSKILDFAMQLRTGIMNVTCSKKKTAICASALAMMANVCIPVYAADITSLLTTVIKIMAILITVLGLFLFITGLISWAQSHADGDGPAQNKAVGKISAGAMLIILSIVLLVNAATLISYIDTSIS